MLNKFRDIINNNIASFIIARDGELLYQDIGIGVKPIIKVIDSNPDLIKDAYVVDKVIGKAAAMLLIKYKAAYVHGVLMSKTAIRMLELHSIPHSYDNVTDTIKNRTNDGLCPLEDSVFETDDLEVGFTNIKNRIAELMAR